LQARDLPPQRCRVEGTVLLFELLGHVGLERPQGEQAPVGRRRGVVVLAHARVAALLGEELHLRLEVVHVEAQHLAEAVQDGELLTRVIARPADRAPHHRPVPLLDVAVVVLAVGARAREADPPLAAVAQQVVVDERGAVVGVETEQRERQTALEQLERLKAPALHLVGHGPHLGPAAGHVGEVEGVAVVATRRAAVVTDEVDLDEAGAALVPLAEGAHRDLAAQEAAGPREARAAQLQAATLAGEEAVDGRHRHREQLRARLVRELELAVTFQRRDGPRHGRCQALAADAAERRPDLGERPQQIGAVDRGAAAAALAARRGSAHLLTQHPCRVASVVAGEGAELVEHQPAPPLAGALVAPRHLLGDRLPLAHR